jgi:ribosomal-protein-alanine N-acetyltransferase
MKADHRYVQEHHTERLLIRPLTEEDIPTWESYFEDPEYLQYIMLPPQPGLSNLQKAEFWIGKQFARYKENRFGLMALVEKSSGELVGQCGLLLQELEGEPVLEIGYHLFREQNGKGYATEAAQFFKKLAFENNYSNELVSIIDVGNQLSEKVAMRNGMSKWKTSVDYLNLKVNVFRIVKREN